MSVESDLLCSTAAVVEIDPPEPEAKPIVNSAPQQEPEWTAPEKQRPLPRKAAPAAPATGPPLIADYGAPGRDHMLPARLVMARFGVVDRTLDRWVADPRLKFPRPVIINKRRYFRLSELEAWERGRVAAA